jgi:hypothetical protein
MTVYLARCRHSPSSPVGMCELQPGVLFCPCLGSSAAPAGRLLVDEAGQLVWTALGPNNNPRAHHTYVALRKGPDGRTTAVPLATSKEVVADAQQGVFRVHVRGEASVASIRIDEFMRRSLAGEEFVHLA